MKSLRGLGILTVVVFAGLALMMASPAMSREKKGKAGKKATVEWSSLPPTVQTALTKELNGTKPNKLKVKRKNGLVEYRTKAKVGGVTKEFKLTADGQVFEVKQKVNPDKLSRTITNAIDKRLPGAKLLKAKKVTLTYYEVKVLKDGKKRRLRLLVNGRKIKVKK